MIGYIIENTKEYIECQKYLIFKKGYEWRYSGQKIKIENILKDFPIIIFVDEYNLRLDSKVFKKDGRYLLSIKENPVTELINWKIFNRSLKLKSII